MKGKPRRRIPIPTSFVPRKQQLLRKRQDGPTFPLRVVPIRSRTGLSGEAASAVPAQPNQREVAQRACPIQQVRGRSKAREGETEQYGHQLDPRKAPARNLP